MSLLLLVKVKKYVLSKRFLSHSACGKEKAQTTLSTADLLRHSADTIIAYLCGQ